MIPRRFPSLGLRDPGFLGQGKIIVPPDPDDPDLWAWFKAGDYCAVQAGTYRITSIGNKINAVVDKTDVTSSYNAGPEGGDYPLLSTTETDEGNCLQRSNDITSTGWSVSNVTRNSATTMTFNAQNAYIYQGFLYASRGKTYRFSVKIKRISGNTALQLYHLRSSSGDTTSITIDGTLTEYSTTVNGPSSSYEIIYFGLRDPNAAGWGQVEVQEWKVTEEGWATTYVQTAHNGPELAMLDGARVIYSGYNACWWIDNDGGGQSLGYPRSVYLLYQPRALHELARLFIGITRNFRMAVQDVATTPREYLSCAAGATLTIPVGEAMTLDTWRISSCVMQTGGVASSLRANKGVAQTGVLTDPAGSDTHIDLFGSASTALYMACGVHEVIIRDVADDTAKQDEIIDYLADQVGMVV